MFIVTIRVVGQDVDEDQILRDLARSMFENTKAIRRTADGCQMWVDGPAGAYAVDQLRLASEDPAFNSFSEWKEVNADQFPLAFGSASVPDPSEATVL